MSGLENVGVAKEQDLLVTIIKKGRRQSANAYPALESVLSYSFFALLLASVLSHVVQSVLCFFSTNLIINFNIKYDKRIHAGVQYSTIYLEIGLHISIYPTIRQAFNNASW